MAVHIGFSLYFHLFCIVALMSEAAYHGGSSVAALCLYAYVDCLPSVKGSTLKANNVRPLGANLFF